MSFLVHQVRRAFYDFGEISTDKEEQLDFGFGGLFWATVDLLPSNDFYSPPGLDISITHFLGTFNYAVYELRSNRVGFWINNRTDRSSGTHFPGRYEEEGYRQRLEDLFAQDASLGDKPLKEVLDPNSGYRLISILSEKTREQTRHPQGGGDMTQTFTWSERNLDCPENELPWPAILLFTGRREWSDYREYTSE
jgi:hypothetical protein